MVNTEGQTDSTMQPDSTMDTVEQPRPRKRGLLIGIGAAALILLLAAAAYVGGRLLNGQGALGQDPGGGSGLRLSLGGPGGNKNYKLDIEPSKELPQTPADVRGLFDHRQDNSIFVGTGRVTMMVNKDPSGNVTTSSNHSGPEIEVVVTGQTKIYKDTTMQQFNGPPPAGQKIQQALEAGSLEEIGQNSQITAWGRKTGDRFIADVLVYSPPAFITK